ncbi:MAG: hypothetical protein ABWY23_10495 [Mycetocola sp.]
MPSEDELRRGLHDDAAGSTYTDAAHTIDVSQVIRRSRARRRSRMLLASSGTALALVGIAVTAAFGVPALTSQFTTPPPFAATPTGAPDPDSGVAPRDQGITPTPDAVPTPTPTGSAVTIPSDCSDIYTKDWTPQMGGLVLNPDPAEHPAADAELLGTTDETLSSTLADTTKLSCDWLIPAEIRHDIGGVHTDVASLTPAQTTTVLARMNDAGFRCVPRFAGTRCDLREESTEGAHGETHIIREGVWIASDWFFVFPDGYTEDIETALFGAAEAPDGAEAPRGAAIAKIVVRPEMLQLVDEAGTDLSTLSYDADATEFVTLFTDLMAADPVIEESPGGKESWPSTIYTWDGVQIWDDHEKEGEMLMNVAISFSEPEIGPRGIAVSTIQGFQPGDDLQWLAEYMDEPYSDEWPTQEVQAEHGPPVGEPMSPDSKYSNSYSVMGHSPLPGTDKTAIVAPRNLGIAGD